MVLWLNIKNVFSLYINILLVEVKLNSKCFLLVHLCFNNCYHTINF
jgi:hypothetical protein